MGKGGYRWGKGGRGRRPCACFPLPDFSPTTALPEDLLHAWDAVQNISVLCTRSLPIVSLKSLPRLGAGADPEALEAMGMMASGKSGGGKGPGEEAFAWAFACRRERALIQAHTHLGTPASCKQAVCMASCCMQCSRRALIALIWPHSHPTPCNSESPSEQRRSAPSRGIEELAMNTIHPKHG